MSHQQTTERPPDAETVRQWYEEGWIDDDGLDELLETAIETYGGEGRREEPDGLERAAMLQAKAETQRVSAPPEAGRVLLLVGFVLGALLALALVVAFPQAVAELFGGEIVTNQEALPL